MNKLKKIDLATTTTVTSTYAGEFAGVYIYAALLAGNTLGENAITLKPNIKYKQVVKKIATADILADATCDFTPVGTVDLTERILEPKELQVNLTLCKADFRSDWEAVAMGYSAHDVLPPKFSEYFLAQVLGMVGEAVELSIWDGTAATSGEFGGFIPLMTADGDVVDVVGTTVTAANVVVELGKVVDAIPNTIYNQNDMTLYVSSNVARAYIRALGGFAADGVGGSGYMAQGNVGSKPLNFDGIPLFLANGMTANYMIAAQARNLWFGTGLMSDQQEVKLLDMADLDGSQNVRVVVRFTGGVQYGLGAECVLYTPA